MFKKKKKKKKKKKTRNLLHNSLFNMSTVICGLEIWHFRMTFDQVLGNKNLNYLGKLFVWQ